MGEAKKNLEIENYMDVDSKTLQNQIQILSNYNNFFNYKFSLRSAKQ